MFNFNTYVYGSKLFYDLLLELSIFKNLKIGTDSNVEREDIIIIFFWNNDAKDLANKIVNLNVPIIFINNEVQLSKKKTYKNNFLVFLKKPIKIYDLLEVVKILLSKFKYFKNSHLLLNKYTLNINDRLLKRDGISLRLTEIEVKLLSFVNKSLKTTKRQIEINVWKYSNNIESHAFETTLHRLRKKIRNKFKDNDFINFKDGQYYLS